LILPGCAGFRLDEHAFESAFSSFDPDRSQACNMIEFWELCVFMKLTAAIFGAFDARRTGNVTLDYNQFVYAASSCR
jgi:hypothetical protein